MPATSGTATIYGQDINVDMDHIRKNLGWCPQHVRHMDSPPLSGHASLRVECPVRKADRRRASAVLLEAEASAE